MANGSTTNNEDINRSDIFKYGVDDSDEDMEPAKILFQAELIWMINLGSNARVCPHNVGGERAGSGNEPVCVASTNRVRHSAADTLEIFPWTQHGRCSFSIWTWKVGT